MKKILIVNNNMHIGGIQKSLLNLVCALKDKYDITLMLFCDIGELLEFVPKEVKILHGNIFLKTLGMTNDEAKRSGFLTYALRSAFTVMTRIFKTKFTFNLISKFQKLNGEYDCAVSFMQNGCETYFYGGCAEFVLKSVKSKNKLCYLHCDFLNYGGNTKYNRDTLRKFDKIAVVSNSVGEKLLEAMPDVKNKVYTSCNFMNYDEIDVLKNEYKPNLDKSKINIFTAARLRHEKGILRMMPIFKNIKEKNKNFVWYVAGDGPDRETAEKLLKEYDLFKNVVFLGNLVNPYPYFYNCDILLVPSYDEAAPMVFYESVYLGTPVFTTDTTSAREMIESIDAGWVCENNDEKIEENLLKIIDGFKAKNLVKADLNNNKAFLQFEKLVGK